MKKTVKISSLKGVTITVICSNTSFDVIIDINEGCNLTRYRKNKFFSVKFSSYGTQPIFHQAMHLSLCDQSFPDNIMFNFKRTIIMPNGMWCTFSLSPSFYLHPSMTTQLKKQEARSKERTQKRKA